MSTLLEARALKRRFGQTQAVAGVDLEVRPGERVGIVGPDGAGKTTLMRLLSGAMAPTAGEIRWGRHVRTGYLSQQFSLYPDLTVMENILFFARMHGQSAHLAQRHAVHWLKWIGLHDFSDRLAGKLSGGMKQKLSLVCALVHEADVLLLDEPTTAVDPVSRREFWSLLTELAGQGKGMVITTPYMDEAERCDRVILLHEGRVLRAGTPEALRRELPGQVIALSAPGLSRLELEAIGARLPGARWAHAFGSSVHALLAEPLAPGQLAQFVQTQACVGLQGRPVLPSLEDVFLALMGEVSI